ncbi:MAG: hypothetical protein WCS97_02790 [Candidatus Paceibacterota bacterium]|jgi:hypothetical protein
MTTVINTPSNTDGGDSGAGWAVAVLILLAVIGVGAYFWLHYRGTAPATSGGTNINVTLPQNPVTSPTPTP